MVTPEEKRLVVEIMEKHDDLLRSLNGGTKKIIR